MPEYDQLEAHFLSKVIEHLAIELPWVEWEKQIT
jgi:hypothetical protein